MIRVLVVAWSLAAVVASCAGGSGSARTIAHEAHGWDDAGLPWADGYCLRVAEDSGMMLDETPFGGRSVDEGEVTELWTCVLTADSWHTEDCSDIGGHLAGEPYYCAVDVVRVVR